MLIPKTDDDIEEIEPDSFEDSDDTQPHAHTRPPPVAAASAKPHTTAGSDPRTLARISQLESHVARLEYELAQKDARIKDLVENRAQLMAKLTELESDTGTAAQLKTLQANLEQARKLNSELEQTLALKDAELEKLGEALKVAQARSAAPRDDLRKIHGIGPAIEKTLNSMGITSYRQIAAFTDEDLDRIAKKLKTRRDRIVQQDWVGAARKLSKADQQG